MNLLPRVAVACLTALCTVAHRKGLLVPLGSVAAVRPGPSETPRPSGQVPQKPFVLSGCIGIWGWATSLAFWNCDDLPPLPPLASGNSCHPVPPGTATPSPSFSEGNRESEGVSCRPVSPRARPRSLATSWGRGSRSEGRLPGSFREQSPGKAEWHWGASLDPNGRGLFFFCRRS